MNDRYNDNERKNPESRRGGRGRGKRRQEQRAGCQHTTTISSSKILVLHGSRQTGELLLGRMEKLRKKLRFLNDNDESKGVCNNTSGIELVAPDGPFHVEGSELRQWWIREGNDYIGLQESLNYLEEFWENKTNGIDDTNISNDTKFEGIIGFSQGARLAHLIALYHMATSKKKFRNLRYVILVSGYQAPIPDSLIHILPRDSMVVNNKTKVQIPSLHVYGMNDSLITPEQSILLTNEYDGAIQIHEHPGSHFVPMKKGDVDTYVQFIKTARLILNQGVEQNPQVAEQQTMLSTATTALASSQHPSPEPVAAKLQIPDEERQGIQQDEVEALTAIFPDEFELLSKKNDDDGSYEFPITYILQLPKSDEGEWPPHPIALKVTYPHDYPQEPSSESKQSSGVKATITLEHKNNMMEFDTCQISGLFNAIENAALEEAGMPNMLTCVYAAREYFESGMMAKSKGVVQKQIMDGALKQAHEDGIAAPLERDGEQQNSFDGIIKSSSSERIQECNLQGLAIAEMLLGRAMESTEPSQSTTKVGDNDTTNSSCKKGSGGSWKFCIGLVGKPSAGKSTFFNAATCFARQRGKADSASSTSGDASKTNSLGGATMAPHPFTTIDPNIGYCLVPAPPGSCPEDDDYDDATKEKISNLKIGSLHGRDPKGRRLLPVILKDVAGLVPGAYQGRGRGNKFLNDLTDADVLIHVVDASGTADTEGNTVGCVENDNREEADVGDGDVVGSHPLNDLAWIRNELVEWVYTNLLFKWNNIKRKGRNKLAGMFSGYGQNETMLWKILSAVEKYLDKHQQRDHALDNLDEWDEADVHRLVSTFLGCRFPMALALNKTDLPTARRYIKDVLDSLPLHGAHVGVPLTARNEMGYVRRHAAEWASFTDEPDLGLRLEQTSVPDGVWQCLHSAMTLREPVLVFPVCDMTTYAPLPGMAGYATGDSSLPNAAFISCLNAAGGESCLPTLWDTNKGIYDNSDHSCTKKSALRDVIMMKPGSTVEDVFLVLKRMGALGGEFVRAEGAGYIFEKAKLVRKHDFIGKTNRILKIMTSKRQQWQA